MSLRVKLLLLGLATLVLPWGGCQYAREMELALREGEENSLQAVSQTIAASLQGRTDLLYREAPLEAGDSDPPADASSAHGFLNPGPYDLKPLALSAAPLLDGYPDDWPRDPAAWAYFAKDARHRFGILTGVYERMLYVLLEVRDQHPVFDAPGTNPLDPATFGDRVWLGFQDSQGEEHQVFLAATGPGAVSARRIESGEYGQQSAPVEPRIRGAWQPMKDGYRIELRVPMSMLGNGFGVLVDDRDARGATPVSYGSLRSDDLHTLGRLIFASPELSAYLAQFIQPGLKLAVRAPSGRVLARADALGQVSGLGGATPIAGAPVPALRRPPRGASAAGILSADLRPRPPEHHRHTRGDADRRSLDPAARPCAHAHAQLQSHHQCGGGDLHVRLRRLAGAAPVAAAARERVGAHPRGPGDQLSGNRGAR